MNHRFPTYLGVAIALVSLALSAAGGRAETAPTWTPPRTAWGEPDLQGIWTNATLTPLERPQALAGKKLLTQAEAAELESQTAKRRARGDGVSRPGSVGGYNQFWMDAGTKVVGSRRTSLIVDPVDGRIPWKPAARVENALEVARYGVGPYDSWADLDTGERCITDGLPNMAPLQPYNMNFHILQTPGYVVLLHEMYHEIRIIPLDGRPHIGRRIGQWLGDPRGRWDGDTLVVETTHFADKTHYYWSAPWRSSRSSLHLIERFTRVDAETIDYEFTVEDATMFSQPWTVSAPMTTNQAARGVTSGHLFEYACHEGNYAIVNILSGARAQETAAADAREK